ncbi:hypothetical protein ACSYAY_10520 [Leptospirillum ferriphilum]|jgi:archaellum component FlaC|uniref:Uncharacterized protein n=2 Tax=Leptospirillum TaxID=179 RepID=A0A094X2J4_9BACT|nr:hypothetical protein [Leptospirillum ferriphilum]EDZ39121.1 MAG: Protein of unknown function [Leptospirillum sp. Group II '5-way CG']KGA92789.1 hypothetical protein LptCag_1623 [Leptospirillum ferriphilum]
MDESIVKGKIEKLNVRRDGLKKKQQELRSSLEKTQQPKDKNLKRIKKRLRRVYQKKNRFAALLPSEKEAGKGEA